MREILFRGKRAVDGKWLYGYYNGGNGITVEFPCIEPIEYNDLSCQWAVLPETVGQYTGLTDKNGKKIFEGDILQAWDFPRDTLTFTVKWYDYGGFNLLGINTKAFNIIGSIHDNPELLEVQK